MTTNNPDVFEAYRQKLRSAGTTQPAETEVSTSVIDSYKDRLRQRKEEEGVLTQRKVEYAMEKNPDRMKDVYDTSERTGIHPSIVEQNFDEVKRKEQVKRLNFNKNPALASFLSDQYNAEVAHDDIDVLSELEDHLGAFTGGIVSLPQMVAGGTAAFIEAGGRMVERALPESWAQSIREFEKDVPAPAISEAFRMAEAGGKQVSDFFTPEDQSYTTQLAGGLGQAAAQIGTMLLAPQTAFPSLFMQNVSQQEQRRDGVRADTAISDLGLMASGGIAVIEKFGLEKLLNRVPAEIQNKIVKKLTDVVVGGGYEAATEVIENIGHGLVDFATNNPDADIFKGVAEDAAVGGGVGAIIRALLPSYKGTSKVNHQSEEVKLVDKTNNEQANIDKAAALLQKSKTAQRGEKIIKRFTDLIPNVKEYKVSSQAFEGYEGEIPQFVKDQTDSISGEFTMTVPQFSTVVNDPELYAAIRPHMRESDDSLSQYEMTAGGPTMVKNIMEQAAESSKMKSEAEKLTKKVIDKLVKTGRISKNNARYAAAVIESYVTTKASNTGMSVKEVFKMMNFDIKRVEDMNYDFGDATIETEITKKETGQKGKMRVKKQMVYDRKLKQREIITKLRDCVNG